MTDTRPNSHTPGTPPAVPGWAYTLVRKLLAPLARGVYRPRIEGMEHLPKEGAVILASNHLSFIDSIVIPLAAAPRPVHFLAKSEYFTGRGSRGWFSRALFTGIGAVPVERGAGQAALDALDQQRRILVTGAAIALHPEGTRSRDGRLYKGRTGVAFLALETGAPVVPIGLIGTDTAMPVGAKLPSRSARITVRFGAPLDLRAHGPATSGRARRTATDAIMGAIHELSEQELADEYNESPAHGVLGRVKRALPHERR